MDIETDEKMLSAERTIRMCENTTETSIAAQCKIIAGDRDKPVKKVIHMFPHTGFNARRLENLTADNPDADTLLASISHVYPGNELILKAEEIGLGFICGNSHALEIFENGLPLAYAIRQLLTFKPIQNLQHQTSFIISNPKFLYQTHSRFLSAFKLRHSS